MTGASITVPETRRKLQSLVSRLDGRISRSTVKFSSPLRFPRTFLTCQARDARASDGRVFVVSGTAGRVRAVGSPGRVQTAEDEPLEMVTNITATIEGPWWLGPHSSSNTTCEVHANRLLNTRGGVHPLAFVEQFLRFHFVVLFSFVQSYCRRKKTHTHTRTRTHQSNCASKEPEWSFLWSFHVSTKMYEHSYVTNTHFCAKFVQHLTTALFYVKSVHSGADNQEAIW